MMRGMCPMTDAGPTPIILDCDPGVDDAIAIIMALGLPDAIDLRAITCVAGNVPLSSTARQRPARYSNWPTGRYPGPWRLHPADHVAHRAHVHRAWQ